MVKETIIFIVILIGIVGCNGKEKISTYKLSDIAQKIDTIKFNNDMNASSRAFELKNYKDSLVIVTDFYDRNIIKYDMNDKTIAIIGDNGSLDGQYTNPHSLDVVNGKIIFNEMNDSRVQRIDFNGMFINKYSGVENHNASFLVARNDSTIYFQNWNSPYFISNNLRKSFYHIPSVFKNAIKRTAGVGGQFIFNDTLYFLNIYEWKVYKINLIDGQEEAIELKYPGSNKYNWSEHYNDTMQYEEIKKIILKHYDVSLQRLYKLELYDKIFFLILYENNNGADNGFLIFDANGNIMHILDEGSKLYAGCYNNVLLFGEYDENTRKMDKLYKVSVNKKFLNK